MHRLFKQYISYLLPGLLLFFACQEKENREAITRLVTEWQGKEILFPEPITFTRYITDTVDYQISESNYKVLVYVDSVGCTSCKLQLNKWKKLIAEVDSVTGGTVPFLFFFHAKDYKEIYYLLKRERFDLPVCIDRNDRLNKRNAFPSDITFQTFLLDRSNRVAVLGNPVHNLAVKDLYLKQITGERNSSARTTETTAEARQTEIDMGTFPYTETRKAVFYIKNTGTHPLVILGTSTTCGCASARFDKQPAGHGEVLQVEVEMAPKESGFFSEIITIKCNTDKTIKLRIKGLAQ